MNRRAPASAAAPCFTSSCESFVAASLAPSVSPRDGPRPEDESAPAAPTAPPPVACSSDLARSRRFPARLAPLARTSAAEANTGSVTSARCVRVSSSGCSSRSTPGCLSFSIREASSRMSCSICSTSSLECRPSSVSARLSRSQTLTLELGVVGSAAAAAAAAALLVAPPLHLRVASTTVNRHPGPPDAATGASRSYSRVQRSAPVAVDAALATAPFALAYAEIPASCAALDAFPAADLSAPLMLLRSIGESGEARRDSEPPRPPSAPPRPTGADSVFVLEILFVVRPRV